MNLIFRKASARWKGGSGTVITGGRRLQRARRTLRSPRKTGTDTDPAELIAAAHASSFSSALFKALGLRGLSTGEIVTTSTVTLEDSSAVWRISDIHLNVVASLRQVTQSEFIDAVLHAKTNCLVSRLLRANISMNAKLDN